jgi:hypothetical protein
VKRHVVLLLVVGLMAGACQPEATNRRIAIKAGDPGQVGEPVRTSAGHFLVGISSGSEAVTSRLDESSGTAVEVFRYSAGGPVMDIQIQTAPSENEVAALEVVTYCPDHALLPADPDYELAKICPVPSKQVSFELDGEGRRTSDPLQLPDYLLVGRLFASGSAYVWHSMDVASLTFKPNRATYIRGSWHPLDAEPTTSQGAGFCATLSGLWALHREGPSSSDVNNAAPGEARWNYGLYRYRLDGAGNSAWETFELPALRENASARLACGEDAAYVQTGTGIFSTQSPEEALDGIPDTILSFSGNRAMRPVVTAATEQTTSPGDTGTLHYRCALLEPNGRLVEATRQPVKDGLRSCGSIPWPAGDRYRTIEDGAASGTITLGTW